MKPPKTEDSIWVTVGYTVNLGNYENIELEMGTSQTLCEGDDPSRIRQDLCKKLTDEVLTLGEDARDEAPRYRRTRPQ